LCRRKQISKYIRENPKKLSTGRTRQNCLQERAGPEKLSSKREELDKIMREPDEIFFKREPNEILFMELPKKFS
jgi:hypothetical protein